MRSEFEKLEEIASIFKIGNFQFNEDEGNYTGTKGTALSYLRGAWVIYQRRQTEVDELHKISVALNTETIRQREQVAYYLSKNAELQKRVDAVKQLIEDYRDPTTEDKTFQHALSIVADELEQALKGGEA